jgi:di/tricarboxylate transporter
LRAGDVLLVQGSRDNIDMLKASGTMLVLDGTMDLPHTHRARRALTVMGLVVLTAAAGIMPISVSALIGVGLMLALGCLNWRNASDALSAPVIMIIVTSLALGRALIGTGMVDYLAMGFVELVSTLPVPVILSAFILIMTVLTNIVANNAAAVIGTPIAVAIAQQLNVDPVPFVLAVIFGANMSFATPFGYQTNLLILSAGGYKFADFLRVGIPLSIIMWLGFHSSRHSSTTCLRDKGTLFQRRTVTGLLVCGMAPFGRLIPERQPGNCPWSRLTRRATDSELLATFGRSWRGEVLDGN